MTTALILIGYFLFILLLMRFFWFVKSSDKNLTKITEENIWEQIARQYQLTYLGIQEHKGFKLPWFYFNDGIAKHDSFCVHTNEGEDIEQAIQRMKSLYQKEEL